MKRTERITERLNHCLIRLGLETMLTARYHKSGAEHVYLFLAAGWDRAWHQARRDERGAA